MNFCIIPCAIACMRSAKAWMADASCCAGVCSTETTNEAAQPPQVSGVCAAALFAMQASSEVTARAATALSPESAASTNAHCVRSSTARKDVSGALSRMASARRTLHCKI